MFIPNNLRLKQRKPGSQSVIWFSFLNIYIFNFSSINNRVTPIEYLVVANMSATL